MSLDSTKICSNKDIYNQIEMQDGQTLQKAARELCKILEKYKVGMSKALFRRFIGQTLQASTNMMEERMQSWPSSASVQELGSEQAQSNFNRMIYDHPIEIGSIQADSRQINFASSASLKQEEKLATFSQKKINHQYSLQQAHFSKKQNEESLPPITLIMKRLNQLYLFSNKIISESKKVQSNLIMITLLGETRLAEMDSLKQKEINIQRLFDCIKAAQTQISVIKKQVRKAVQCHKGISQQISSLSSGSQAEQETQWNNIKRKAADNYGELIMLNLKSTFQTTINKIKKGRQILNNFASFIGQQKLAHKQHEAYVPQNQSSKNNYEFTSSKSQNLMQFAQNKPKDRIVQTMVYQSVQSIKNFAKMTQKYAQLTAQSVTFLQQLRTVAEKIAIQSSQSGSNIQAILKKIVVIHQDTKICMQDVREKSIHAEEAFETILRERKKISRNLQSDKQGWMEEILHAEYEAEKSKNNTAQNQRLATLLLQRILKSLEAAQVVFSRRALSPNPAKKQEKSLEDHKQKQVYQKVQKQHSQAQNNQQDSPYFNRGEGLSSTIAKNTKSVEKIRFRKTK